MIQRKHFVVILFLILGFDASPSSVYAQDNPNTITFDNKSGEPALVKLIGPTGQAVEVPNGDSRTVNTAAGEYYILTRYGSKPKGYKYAKGDPFTVVQTESEYSIITITLHPVIGGNYATHPISADEFENIPVIAERTDHPEDIKTLTPILPPLFLQPIPKIELLPPMIQQPSPNNIGNDNNIDTYPSGSMAVKVSERWRARIGLTTYRSTIHFFNNKIIVNSNGSSWKDSNDPDGGIYIIEPLTGSIIKQIVPPGSGEKDCNGVALNNDDIVFGTDQGIVYTVDWNGKVLWQRELKGDIEAAPALSDLNGDKILDIVTGSEEGILYALNGKDGEIIWEAQAGYGAYDQTGFVATAAFFDATGDGIDDIFIPSRDEVFRVINGKTGKIIWSYKGDSGMHGTPIIVDVDNDGNPEVIFTESYSTVYCADARTGTIKWNTTLKHPGFGIEGLFSPVGWFPDAKCILVATAWWRQNEGVYCLSALDGKIKWRYEEPTHNITSGFVIGDVDGKPGAEAVFGTESGKVIALDKDGNLVWTYMTGGPIECTPTLADIDGDGLIEVIAASNDGFLYAIATPGKAPAVINYHRGSPQNNGNL